MSSTLLLLRVQVDIGKVATLCSLLYAFIFKNNPPVDLTMEPTKLHPFICTLFFFAYVWSIGGNLVEKSMDAFDSFVRELFSDTHDVKVQFAEVWWRTHMSTLDGRGSTATVHACIVCIRTYVRTYVHITCMQICCSQFIGAR